MTELTRHRQIILVDRRELNNEFYKEFSKFYLSLKVDGITPNQILDTMTKVMKCSRSSYYSYLRDARELGLITDSYAENRAALNTRTKRYVTSNDAEVLTKLIRDNAPNVSQEVEVEPTTLSNEEVVTGSCSFDDNGATCNTNEYSTLNTNDPAIQDLRHSVWIEGEVPGIITIVENGDSLSITHTTTDLEDHHEMDKAFNNLKVTDESNIITTTEGIQIVDVDGDNNDTDKPMKESEPVTTREALSKLGSIMTKILSFFGKK